LRCQAYGCFYTFSDLDRPMIGEAEAIANHVR